MAVYIGVDPGLVRAGIAAVRPGGTSGADLVATCLVTTDAKRHNKDRLREVGAAFRSLAEGILDSSWDELVVGIEDPFIAAPKLRQFGDGGYQEGVAKARDAGTLMRCADRIGTICDEVLHCEWLLVSPMDVKRAYGCTQTGGKSPLVRMAQSMFPGLQLPKYLIGERAGQVNDEVASHVVDALGVALVVMRSKTAQNAGVEVRTANRETTASRRGRRSRRFGDAPQRFDNEPATAVLSLGPGGMRIEHEGSTANE